MYILFKIANSFLLDRLWVFCKNTNWCFCTVSSNTVCLFSATSKLKTSGYSDMISWAKRPCWWIIEMIISFLNYVDEFFRLMSSKDNPIVGWTGNCTQKSFNTVVDSIYNVAAHSPVFCTSSISRGTPRYYDLSVAWNIYWNTAAVVMRDSRRWLFTYWCVFTYVPCMII